MKRENIWFMTLLTLVVALSVLYVVLPTDITLSAKPVNSSPEEQSDILDVTGDIEDVTITECDTITAMRVARDEELEVMINEANDTINSQESSTTDKNNAYEIIKNVDSIKSMEEKLENIVKEKYQLANFVKIDNNNIEVVVATTNYDKTLANNIMRSIQENFDTHKYITVKFEI